MVGRVGKDIFGPRLLDALKNDGIDVTGVAEDPDHPSGVGMIVLNAERQNHVLAIYGANLRCDEDQLAEVEAALDGADVLLLQMELPFHLSIAAARAAQSRGVVTMLDPAPASDIPPEAFRHIDIITPNQTEAEYHTGIRVNDVPSAQEAAELLLEKGVGTAIVKLAEQGVYWASRNASGYQPAYEVEVVDTISAGDAFSGALAVALGEGRSMKEAVRYGAAAGALAVTKRGRPDCYAYTRGGRRLIQSWRVMSMACHEFICLHIHIGTPSNNIRHSYRVRNIDAQAEAPCMDK